MNTSRSCYYIFWLKSVPDKEGINTCPISQRIHSDRNARIYCATKRIINVWDFRKADFTRRSSIVSIVEWSRIRPCNISGFRYTREVNLSNDTYEHSLYHSLQPGPAKFILTYIPSQGWVSSCTCVFARWTSTLSSSIVGAPTIWCHHLLWRKNLGIEVDGLLQVTKMSPTPTSLVRRSQSWNSWKRPQLNRPQ